MIPYSYNAITTQTTAMALPFTVLLDLHYHSSGLLQYLQSVSSGDTAVLHQPITQSQHKLQAYSYHLKILIEVHYDINGLVQDCSISSALAVEILQSCTNL